MTALITIRMGGSVVQACDARCYGAKHEPCTCVCDGECHGVGLVEAIAIIRRRHPDWIAAAGEEAEVELDDVLFQEPLFTIGDPMVQMRFMGDDPERVREVARLVMKILAASGEVHVDDRGEAFNRRGQGIRVFAEVTPAPAAPDQRRTP